MKIFFSVAVAFVAFNSLSYSQTKMIINKYDGTTDSLSFSDIKSITFISNLVKNGEFNSSLDNWILIGNGTNPYHPEDPGRADFAVANGVLSIDIKNQGTWEYSIMLYQSVLFEKGTKYTVSFDAMADSLMQIISNVTQDGSWKNYSGDKVFQATTTMSSYSYQFTMTDSGAALFQFCLGAAGTRNLHIDNIVITKS